MPTETEVEFRGIIIPIMHEYMIPPASTDAICNAYAERWRSYHATAHPFGMVRTALQLPLSFDDRGRLALLVIYHDVWYKVGYGHGVNERSSVEWCLNDLEKFTGRKDFLFPLIEQGILATIDHTLSDVEKPFVEIVSYLLDLDLWGLGQSPEHFQADTEKVWLEFEPIYTRTQFNRGRSNWAAAFLKRPRIYQTEHFAYLEKQARANLQALADQ
jgi:predicted metal-dependent HD superfamily phosphohydrolase